MARNAEVIRQWQLLLAIERNRFGVTLDDMAKLTGVGKRTIWRDMQALQEAGFPLASDKAERLPTIVLTVVLGVVHRRVSTLTVEGPCQQTGEMAG